MSGQFDRKRNFGHSLFVGWVESAGGLDFSASGGPTYLPAIFVRSAKPNKMAEDRTIPKFYKERGRRRRRKLKELRQLI
jgi:hypothetical protein